MSSGPVLEREEYVEQAYFFRVFRERLAENLSTQEILAGIDEEILTTTRLPMAVQYLTTELRHTGSLANGFRRLRHYFSPFQAFVVQQSEEEKQRFSIATALLILEREAAYKAKDPTRPGLFVYQFESLCRNRLGYLNGLHAMANDPHYDADWKQYLTVLARQVGLVDFAELVYARSAVYVTDQKKVDPAYVSSLTPLFGEKEGKIARASFHRDPLFLFAALQRQLGYPEVPRPRPRDDAAARIDAFSVKIRDMDARIKLLEGELRGSIDLTQLAKPDLLQNDD